MKRNFGLDLYRSLAIGMVLAAHSLTYFYSHWFNALPMEYIFGLGVEIFFALSGFLIGGILIRDLVENRQPTNPFRKLLSFYARRWLRTLPLYYLMVVVTVIYLWCLSGQITPIDRVTLLANLFFVQNFQHQWLNFQPVSWSLSIEEWFYLLIPLGLLVVSLVKQRLWRVRLLLGYGVGIVLLVLAYRTADFLLFHSSWDFGTRKQIFQHLDALTFGVLAAWLKYYHRSAYLFLARNPIFVLVTVLVATITAYTLVYVPIADNTINSSLAAHSICFTLLGICFAALVMTLDVGLETARHLPAWIVRVIQHISTRSYGYYLIHWPIFITLSLHVMIGNLAQNAGLGCVALALTAAVAAVVYRAYELPIIELRDRLHIVPLSPAIAAKEPTAEGSGTLSRIYSASRPTLPS